MSGKFIHDRSAVGWDNVAMWEYYFQVISQVTRDYFCDFGGDDISTLWSAFELEEPMIIWENLETKDMRLSSVTGESFVIHLNKDQDAYQSHFRDPPTYADSKLR